MNIRYSHVETLPAVRDALKSLAQAVHAQHKQYDGYFDNWVLGVYRGQGVWKSKGGAQFFPGDVVLISPTAEQHPHDEYPHHTVFNPSTTSNCSVAAHDIEILA